jgi:hypothetical protein
MWVLATYNGDGGLVAPDQFVLSYSAKYNNAVVAT